MAAVNFGGIIPFSTVDWRGKAALVIFLKGCPLRCIYCQNATLIDGSNLVELEQIETDLLKNKDFIDAVVLSGGEPFMQSQAVESISRFAKNHALFVAAQTCGFYPVVVESILDKNVMDKLFLDIKAPLSDHKRYDRITRASGIASRVRKTLDVCLHAEVDLELVTTVFKHLVGLEEVKRIAHDLEEAGATECPYIIQQGRTGLVSNRALNENVVFSREELKELAAGAYQAARLKEVRIRTREAGEEVICGG